MRASHFEMDGEQLTVALEALIRDQLETVTYRQLGRAHIDAGRLLQHQRRVGVLFIDPTEPQRKCKPRS